MYLFDKVRKQNINHASPFITEDTPDKHPLA